MTTQVEVRTVFSSFEEAQAFAHLTSALARETTIYMRFDGLPEDVPAPAPERSKVFDEVTLRMSRSQRMVYNYLKLNGKPVSAKFLNEHLQTSGGYEYGTGTSVAAGLSRDGTIRRVARGIYALKEE